MKRTQATIRNEISLLQKEIGILDNEQEAYDELTDVQRLAILLHELLCRNNHTDGCSWGYEINNGIHDWDSGRWAHTHYIELAESLLGRVSDLDVEDVRYNTLTIIKALAEVR